jgi:hypothetical protein
MKVAMVRSCTLLPLLVSRLSNFPNFTPLAFLHIKINLNLFGCSTETTLVGRGQYLHDSTTFPKLWEEVAEKTDTVGQWKVDARFTLREKRPGRDHDAAFFIGEGVGWLVFSVERI